MRRVTYIPAPSGSVGLPICTGRRCRFFLKLFFHLLVAVFSHRTCDASRRDIRGQSLLEATAFMGGGQPVGIVEIAPVPSNVLESPEFSTLLRDYTEDVTAERRKAECRLWIDVDGYKARQAAAQASWTADGGHVEFIPDSLAQYGGDCSTLNTAFGAVVKDGSSPPGKSATSVVECTAGPWFAEVVIKELESKTSAQGSPYFLAHLDYDPPLPGFLTSELPTSLPLAPAHRAEWAENFRLPEPGDRATLLCLERGRQLIFQRDTEDSGQYLKFLPGPWCVEVQVEMFADPLRAMGVGVQLRLIENLSVTLPPSRILPVSTAGLTDEQWLLLELADLRSEEQRQREAGYEEYGTVGEHWGEATHNMGGRTFARLPSYPQGPCRLRRGKAFDDPVVLDCLPSVQPPNKKAIWMNAADILRRGVWGLYLAVLPRTAVNIPFHSLIKTLSSNRDSAGGKLPDIFVFSIKREWNVIFPENAVGKKGNANRQAALKRLVWTPEQNKELDLIASEILQAYARGGKDRKKHTTEKHMKFIETDSKLEVLVSVAYLSRRRRKLLGLSKYSGAELVFTFADAGGTFRPFIKVPASQQAPNVGLQQNGSVGETSSPSLRRKQAADPRAVDSEGRSLELAIRAIPESLADRDVSVVQTSSSSRLEPTEEEGQEERITMLQLAWNNVAEPQHEELKRIAIANVLWDVGVSAVLLMIFCVLARKLGWWSGRSTAAELKDRRIVRLATFETNDLPIVPGPQDEVPSSLLEFSPKEDLFLPSAPTESHIPAVGALAAGSS